jgi:glucose 1-dehydrogenase
MERQPISAEKETRMDRDLVMETDLSSMQDPTLPQVVMPSCPIERTLVGQKALVTGASSGIGKGIAIGLGHAGAEVVVNYVKDEDEAEQIVEEIKRCGGRGYAHRCDVSQEDQVEEMLARMIRELGTIDILVNNAGLQQDAPLHQMTLAQWNKVIAVNLTGQFLCARAAVREFCRRGVRAEVSCSAGKILGISSVHDIIPWAGHVNYAASKGGVSMMMKSIAQDVAPYRIRVNSICPGAVRTPINMQAWSTREAYAELMKLVPYKRIGEVDDIARAAVWLASDESDYITGASLYIDGGMTLYPGFETGG